MARHEQLVINEANIERFRYPTRGTVTQQTNRTTAVTINQPTGSITTDATSLAAAAEAAFTVNNSYVKANSVVLVCLKTKSGTAVSLPFVTAVADGSFQITMSNVDAATADTSASVINFAVIQADA